MARSQKSHGDKPVSDLVSQFRMRVNAVSARFVCLPHAWTLSVLAAFGAILAGCGGPPRAARQQAARGIAFQPSAAMTAAVAAPATGEPSGSLRAVSLRALSEAAQACMPQKSCTQEVTELGGLRHVMGYVLDPPHQDIVLIGYESAGAPPLRTEDLVIALKSAWREYAVMEDNTQVFTPVGCSIDPRPETLTELEAVRRSIFGDGSVSPEQARARFDEWRRVAAKPQGVRVLGLGRDSGSHFARVMLDADYFMKRLVDGSAPGAIPGLTSLMDRRAGIMRAEMRSGAPGSLPASVLNRFWFTPGDIVFHEDNNIVVMAAAPVKLLTEEEALASPTSIVGKGHADPMAKEFTNNFTAKYRDIAAAWPVYAELEGLFRLVTLCEALKQKTLSQSAAAFSQAQASPQAASLPQAGQYQQPEPDLSYLLKGYPVEAEAIPQTLPGLGSIREIQDVKTEFGKDARTTQTSYYWDMICGGVNMQIELAKSAFLKSTGGELHKTMDEVLAARPSSRAVSWSVPGAAPLLAP